MKEKGQAWADNPLEKRIERGAAVVQRCSQLVGALAVSLTDPEIYCQLGSLCLSAVQIYLPAFI